MCGKRGNKVNFLVMCHYCLVLRFWLNYLEIRKRNIKIILKTKSIQL
uniref:Uncharacterized protein n=1 Tax=Meloidogyne enterolobii TaxID=390850 RepID=A0A6V7WWU8_MELEN|nr:unnamed protein product [Meloidogyne enterolobii]